MESTKTPLIIGVLVTLVVAGGAIWWVAGRDDTEPAQSNTTSQTEAAQSSENQTPATKTIVDVAVADENFSTLVTAVKAAELVTTLSDTTNKFTVFAPTNDAFAKLPAGTVESLVKPENKQTLSGILTYHVVEGEVLSSQLSNGQVVKTVQGGNLTVSIEGSNVYLTDAKGGKAKVTAADIKADNGVVHVIDSVVMPN